MLSFRTVFLALVACCLGVTNARTRTYYIAAVEVDWDYAPRGNLVNDDNVTSDMFMKNGPDRIGKVYTKAIYREYTDASFTVRVPSPEYLGFLGPLMRGEEGDSIVVVFRNLAFLSGRNFSVHPHGTMYLKQHEGALYIDNTNGTLKVDDGVPPGQTFTYVWNITPNFAPTSDDDPCVPWAYHSHTDSVRDVDTGMMGLLLTCKKGTLLGTTGEKRRDVYAEYALYVDATDETMSWLFRQNLNKCGNPDLCRSLVGNPAFTASNLMHHINGRMYGNLEGLVASSRILTQPVVFYLFSINREVHSVHFSGQVLTVRGQRTDSVNLYSATFMAAFMMPMFPGKWLLSDRVTENFEGGQTAFLEVESSTRLLYPQYSFYPYYGVYPKSWSSAPPRLSYPLSPYPTYSFDRGDVGPAYNSPGVVVGPTANPPQPLYQPSSGELSYTNGSRPGMDSLRLFIKEQNLPQPIVPMMMAEGERGYHPVSNPHPWTGHPWWNPGQNVGYRRTSSADRQYFLAIEDYDWDYAPSGQDLFNGGPLTAPGTDSAVYFTRGPNRIGGVYRKSRYVEFTDSTFTSRVTRDPKEVHLGLLGPVLEMEVGDTVEVTVRNLANRPYSFFPHGLHFTKDQEGFLYKNPDTGNIEGKAVPPGQTETYSFVVPELGRNEDTPCIMQTYHSAVDPVRDVMTGLLGPLLLCQRQQLPKPVLFGPFSHRYGLRNRYVVYGSRATSWYVKFRQIFLAFLVVDENLSWHLQYNINTYTTNPSSVNVSDPAFRGSNMMHSINGRMYGNLEGLDVCRGEQLAWHLFTMGDRFNFHGANFHGQALQIDGNHVNAKILIPGTAITLTSVPDTLGEWSVVCRTNVHFRTGMVDKYRVHDCPGLNYQPEPLNGVVRHYYVAAEERFHDYAPLKRDLITSESLLNASHPGYIFVRDDFGFIGTVYKKIRYIRYTDDRFTVPFPLGPEDEHLGVLGPVLAAEVGDTMRVHFLNRANRPYSMHPQGVQYNKDNEGAKYVDGENPAPGDMVMPGNSFVYQWTVPTSAGPGPSDPGCVPWMYYSSTSSIEDMNTGLVGPLLTCRRGILVEGPNGKLRRRDVDKEFWQIYWVMEESASWLFQDNILQFAPERNGTDLTEAQFAMSNLKFTINGKIYGNLNGMVMDEGDTVAFHLFSLGMQFHPVHFHGQTFIHQTNYKEHRGDVLEVFPSTSVTVTMFCDNPGTWLVHCHLGPHATFGMEATYTIRPAL